MTKWLLVTGVLMPRYSIQATQDPEAVYNRVCIVCQLVNCPQHRHPVIGKPEGQGQDMEAPVQHVTQGFKAMPPRGLCMDCSVEVYRLIIVR